MADSDDDDNGGSVDSEDYNDDVDDEEDDDDDDDDDEEDDDDDEEESDDDGSEDEEIENKETFIRTFHNGDYDAGIDDALDFDRSIIPPDRPTQASYIKPDNWVERNRIGLEKMKEHLQTCINNASHNKSINLQLEHNCQWNQQLVEGEEPIVWHESILDGYWDELEAKILGRKKRVKIKQIDIENVEIKTERLAALVAIFSNGRANNSSYLTVEINNANLCEEGIKSLSELVDVSSKLCTFRLHHNRIDNMDSANCLSRSLKSNACIHQLHLSHCDLGSSPEILLVILQSDIDYINLDNNNIDSLGAVKIAEYLEGNPPIEFLSLDHNRLNDDDAILISQALKRNTNLTEIYLHSNNFTSIGVKALLSCVFDNSSLNAISESNHTLTKIYLFSPGQASDTKSCINSLLKLDWTWKIVLVLQDKDSLLQYFANVPVELIPEVLEVLAQIDDECPQKLLNIVYFTMRWWNMPVLYSYYHLCAKSNSKTKRKRRKE